MSGNACDGYSREPTWDERHESIERALIAYLGRALGASASYDDTIQSWFATAEGGGGLTIDVTDMASDINVALGPTPEMVGWREADVSRASGDGVESAVLDEARPRHAET